ncbi:MAG: hypothetical protein ACFBSC_04985 [Microcoleaceae cyanobacterium]
MFIGLELLFALLVQAPSENANDCASLVRERTEALAEIDQQATEASDQLETQLGDPEFQQQVHHRQLQLEVQLIALAQDEAQLNELIQAGRLPAPVVEVLQAARSNPNAIKEFVNQQAETLPQRLRSQLQERKEELIQQVPALPPECTPQN